MKKIFILFFALAASMETLFAWDYEQVQIDDFYYNLDASNQTAEVTFGGTYPSEAVIPSSVTYESTTYSVTSIDDYAFGSCSGLTSVTIPNSVTSIGNGAFGGCTSLPVVDNIRYADTYLVEAADKTLSAYNIKEGTKWVGNSAFQNCSGLSSIEIPNSVTSIESEAFIYCSSLTSVTIPNSVTSIGSFAFYSCSGLTSVTIPNSVTSIGIRAFSYCASMTSIVVEDGNSVYDSRNNCNAIIETASNTLIAGCNNTIIPNNVISIGSEAFGACSGLTSIMNYAATPQNINNAVFMSNTASYPKIDKSVCVLYVPAKSIDLYKAADVWKDFENILAIPGTEVDEEDVNINYLNKAGGVIDSEQVTLTMPVAPTIEGFTFLKWAIVAGDLEDGINIQAVYTANTPTEAPAVYTNPANPAQKLIRYGNVYILTDDHTYTITGQAVK